MLYVSFEKILAQVETYYHVYILHLIEDNGDTAIHYINFKLK